MGIVVCDVTPKGRFQKLALDLSPEGQKEARPCTSRVVGVLPPWRTVDLRAEDKAGGQSLEDNVDTARG